MKAYQVTFMSGDFMSSEYEDEEILATDCVVHDCGALILHRDGIVQKIYNSSEWCTISLVGEFCEGCSCE